jgi:NADH-quinone oxidoreductase subunit H
VGVDKIKTSWVPLPFVPSHRGEGKFFEEYDGFCMPMTWVLGLIFLIIKLVVLMVVLLTAAAYLVWVERKLLGRMQARYGPNRAGPFGLLQPLVDLIKLVTKEDTVPQDASKTIFLLAPAIVALVALLTFSVVPFGKGVTLWGRSVPLVITDLNVGLLFILALSAFSVYGVALGGWASNSKYSLLGGIRGAAQMISYELPLGLSLVPIVMLARSFSLVEITNAQRAYPFILVQPVSFILFFIASVAEIKRIPFDLPEAENELGAGYHTEYSGLRFGLFFLGEYITMIVLGSLVAVFFLGGWHGPLLPPVIWFALKVWVIVFVLIWLRASYPRSRYDQLMNIGWKVLIPVALLNIIVTGGVILALRP